MDLKVDNSGLTGEFESQEREANHKGLNARPAEADNLVHITVVRMFLLLIKSL
jgi:hypothetical protein